MQNFMGTFYRFSHGENLPEKKNVGFSVNEMDIKEIFSHVMIVSADLRLFKGPILCKIYFTNVF